MYSVKSCFYTLQGEGKHAGRPAVFLRFAGCNLWTGREQDRHKATCQFCDTDFVGTDGEGGGTFREAGALAAHVAARWPDARGDLSHLLLLASRFSLLWYGAGSGMPASANPLSLSRQASQRPHAAPSESGS